MCVLVGKKMGIISYTCHLYFGLYDLFKPSLVVKGKFNCLVISLQGIIILI